MRKVFDTNEEYHKHKCISASGLKMIYKNSVKYYMNKVVKSTTAMDYGTAVHTALLEGETQFFNDFYIMPKINRRTKEGKALYAEHLEKSQNKKIIDDDQWTLIQCIMDDLQSPQKKHILPFLEGEKELSHYGSMHGVECRVRPDCINYTEGFISDIKTCQDTSPEAFRYDIFKWCYHIQATFYSDFVGIDPKYFYFITIMSQMREKDDKKYPYVDCQLNKLDDKFIELGRDCYKKALSSWKLYLEKNIENGYIYPHIDPDTKSYIITHDRVRD
jgi:exodeoxyribonuclease VIII